MILINFDFTYNKLNIGFVQRILALHVIEYI